MTMTENASASSSWRTRYDPYGGIDYTHHCGVGYPDKSLAEDLKRLHQLWRKVQSDRRRDAIYSFLSGVYDLVECWQVENQVAQRIKRARAMTGNAALGQSEPFGAILTAAIAPARLERRKLSKYVRALRLTASHKRAGRRLDRFMKRNGGLNGCAGKLAGERRRGR